MSTRFFAPVAALAAMLALAGPALAARDHVRVEGKTRTIFGSTSPVVDGGANALTALDAASAAGEFYYHVTPTGFGPYIDQVGRFAAGGSSGWVFKVDGVSPPVGADSVQLKDGDTVLWYWADFGPNGGPPTLELRRAGRCYSVTAQDDNGKTTPATGAILHVGSRRTVTTSAGRACVRPHPGLLVRATMDGAVRSNALP